MLETRALKVAYIFDIRGLVAYELVAYEKKMFTALSYRKICLYAYKGSFLSCFLFKSLRIKSLKPLQSVSLHVHPFL